MILNILKLFSSKYLEIVPAAFTTLVATGRTEVCQPLQLQLKKFVKNF